MEMNDPLRREEKKEPRPDQDKTGPGSPDSSRPGRDNLLKRMKKLTQNNPKNTSNAPANEISIRNQYLRRGIF